ncbi:MAG: manganese efflux pump [Phycisphaerae bacterium]|nr:manganese efflux pump [Phycisphaerae bacterium]
MNFAEIVGVAFGLAMDAFAVAIATGLAVEHVTGRHVFRIAWHFGLFQCLMPIVGWLAGLAVAGAIAAFDHWLVLGLLGYIGGKMVYEALRPTSRENELAEDQCDPTRGLVLLTLALATSIDALAAGLSMAIMGVSIWLPAFIIGLVAGGMSFVGTKFGSRLGRRFGRTAEVLGGLVLIAIGVKTALVHGLDHGILS